MKMVINNNYGGFGLDVAKKHEKWVLGFEGDRTNVELVEFVENHPDKCGDLVVVTIPEEATDWEMNEEDGWESIIYVLNGKIVHVDPDD